MKDAIVGVLIVAVVFLAVDFVYSEQNTCVIRNSYGTKISKCGILKKSLDIDINVLDRYW